MLHLQIPDIHRNVAGSGGQNLPPPCVTDPPSIHLSHVSHSYYANDEILHVGSILVRTNGIDPIDHCGIIEWRKAKSAKGEKKF